ncbi:hypothetical protein GYMLUDRAFT_41664 [Collybiopsis luxurians FD-317 M1]|uniref:Cyclohexanone monooxygenase n=1 Tax=Collybiopsis luxurians FD-317 M1 TaxID=944289 RepID=A0A0D0C3P0_9AGAR|nr:hypothetical protein GYMLUDRAFT_41664 [Collybiopsis luxurians FD-317 M1]
MPQAREYYDALIIGAGFSGIHQLHHLRKLGLTAKIIEAGSDLGGTWYWNTYPGARVDSELPIYQFSDPELWKDFTFSEKFPGWQEIQKYFQYVDKKLGIKQDVIFNSRVASAAWDDSDDQWAVTTEDGRVFHSQFLLLCTGIGSKAYIPNFKGLETFKGEMHHTSRWPKEYNFEGKRVGVIGTGATGVQVIQTIASEVRHLTVFQRTPNLCLPMRQRQISKEEHDKKKEDLYPILFNRRNQTFAGFLHDFDAKLTLDATPEERAIFFEDKWEKGGFHLWLGTYIDLFTDEKASDETYAFWRKKTLERISHLPTELQEKLAPVKPPHPFGTKRPSLEQSYLEVYGRPNVTLVDVSESPIEEVTPNGIKTADGVEHPLDVLVLATGFDMVTGGITSIDIRGQDGIPIKEKWNTEGVRSYLGLAAATYPNMFWIYGPQSPSSFSNGPSSLELTSEWILDMIKYMKENNISSAVPTEGAQHAYSELVNQLGQTGLWFKAKSWYLGCNVEGKRVQMLQFPGGIPAYAKLCNDSANKGYDGFDLKRFAN